MFNRIRAVLLTHVSRRINVVPLIVGLIFFMLAWRFAGTHKWRSIAPISRPWTQSIVTGDFSARHHSGRNLPVTEWNWSSFDRNVEALVLGSGPEIPWDRLSDMPKLRQLHLYEFQAQLPKYSADRRLLPNELERLQELSKLRLLSLPNAAFSAVNVQPLAKLNRLEHLIVSQSTFEAGLESLPVFPELQILEIGIGDLTPPAVDYLKKLPKLEQLVVQDGRSPRRMWTITNKPPRPSDTPMPQLQADAIGRLGELPKLKTVYLPGREWHDYETHAIRALPRISVRPLAVDSRRVSVLLFLSFALTALVSIVAQAGIGHFSRSASLLAPNYRFPHHLLTWAWTGSAIALTTLLAVCWGYPLISTAALFSFVGGFALYLLGVHIVDSGPLMKRILIRLLFPLLGLAVGALPTIATSNASVATYMRRAMYGEVPWLTCTALGAGIGLVVCSYRALNRLHRGMAEAGLPTPLLMVQDLGSVTTQQQSSSPKEKRRIPMWQMSPTDAEIIDASAGYHGDDQRKRRTLMGLPSATKRASRRNVYASLLFYVPFQVAIIFLIRTADQFNANEQTAALLVFPVFHFALMIYLLLLNAVFTYGRWRQRKAVFGYELCRPISRSTFVDDLFAEFRRNAVILPVCLVVISSLSCVIQSVSLSSVGWALGLAALAFGVSLLLYAVVMWLLADDREWVPIVVGLLTLLLLFASIALIMWLSGTTSRSVAVKPSMIALVGLLLASIGGVIFQSAKRRWLTLEFATLA